MLLKNKTILITGGTGSFGEAVLKNFLLFDQQGFYSQKSMVLDF